MSADPAAIPLKVWEKASFDLNTPSGRVRIHQRLVTALIEVDPALPLVEGLIDTGAPLSVLPQSVWGPIAPKIEWLSELHDANLPIWLKNAGGLTGGLIPCRVGHIVISLSDEFRRQLGPKIGLIAKFAFDERRLCHRMLVGLFGAPMEFGFHWTGGSDPSAWMDSTSTSR